MSLQFVLGNSGSGKSVFLYEDVLKEAQAHPEKDFLYLVPEQFTMQTQREFVMRHPAHSILNIDVLSFQRLAYRVFDDLGMMDFVVLEETGKNLVLRKAAALCEKELQIFQGNIRRTGYISELKSLISELMQYHVSPEDIRQVRDALEQKNALWYKLGDILTLYRAFREYLEGKYITADEIVDLLTQVAPQSEMLKGSVVVLDGYTGFTPVQNRFLEELFPLAESVRVALTMDSREAVYGAPDIQDLFYLSRKTIHTLCGIAKEKGTEVLEPIVLRDGGEKRYQKAPAIFHLEQNLFRRHPQKFSEEQDEIQIFCFFQPKDELEYAASQIHALAAEGRYRYKDMAVVTGDVPSYADYAEEIFERYGIPLFIDRKKNILFHPLIELVRAVLEMENTGYTYESVMRFFRTGLSGVETETIDLIENYMLAFAVRGFQRWEQPWVRPAKWLEEAELEYLNEQREAFVALVGPLHGAFHKKQASARELATALYEFLEMLQADERLAQQKKQFEAEGLLAQAKENEQIYGIVLDLLEKIVELLGDETMTGKEFAEILDAGFEASSVGVIPPGYDRVLFGDIERTRLDHISVLFFIGVNDGIIPKNAQAQGILSEFERETLSGFDIELAPTAREKSFIQKFYLYLNMTKPSERLYLTFSQAGQDGEARRRSYLVNVVLRLFPQMSCRTAEPDAAATPQSSMRYFLAGLAEAKNGAAAEEWRALYAWYMRHENWAGTVAEYVKAAFYRHRDSVLETDLCRQLYGTALENSVTRLERFAGCAFAHFLQYGLQLAERQTSEFEAADFGNILHSALEQFAKRMQAGGDDWFRITEERQKKYAKEAIDLAIAACANAALAEGARNGYLVRRMETVLNRTVETLGRQIRSGSFIPESYETSFQSVSSLDAIHFKLGEEEKMRLRGRIDRMDVWEREKEVYVRVIDYKSGNTSFQLLSVYHGLQLQLVVYLNAAMELMQKKFPEKEVKPGGIFYYHIDDPLIETDEELSDEEVRERIFAKLKLDGYVNSDSAVYREMDHGMQSASDILPVTENKDGTLRKNSKAASEAQFAAISKFVSRKLTELGTRMMNGEIAVNPYMLGADTPCGYCPYRSVCGFDERIPGYGYRRLQKLDTASEIIQKMSEDHKEG